MRLAPQWKPVAWLAAGLAVIYVAYAALVFWNQRRLLYFPSASSADTALTPWIVDGRIIGYGRVVARPRTIWLMAHGNAGQASGRAYVLPHLSVHDSLYVLEYPGYGQRAGTPSKALINRAAAEAYVALRRMAPAEPVCVIGESLGSGPASFLGTLPDPPDKIVLVVPFDVLADVAAEHLPLLPARLMLRDDWDNIAALRGYRKPLEIYGASDDEVIGCAHARNLAAHLPGAQYVEIPGGHNEWSQSERVRFER